MDLLPLVDGDDPAAAGNVHRRPDMGSRDIAGENLAVLQIYAPDTFKTLEKRFRETDEKATRAAMLTWMVDNGFGDERAPGHGSGKPGSAMQPGTAAYIKKVAQKLR